MGMAALRAGAHVFFEKPFTPFPAQADELLAEAAARGLRCAVAHQVRMQPSALFLRQQVEADGTHIVELEGETMLTASDVVVPRDPSSAAFPMVAALITEGSDLSIPGIGMNPLRTGLITTLQEMGGDTPGNHCLLGQRRFGHTCAGSFPPASHRPRPGAAHA